MPDRSLMHGVVPLTARLEPWAAELLDDPDACAALLDEHGSPVNVLDLTPLRRHVEELRDAASRHGLELDVLVARKANRTLALVDTALAAGAGVDVASLDELAGTLARGVAPRDVVVTAAVKPHALCALALENDVLLCLDNPDEASDVAALATRRGRAARVTLRLAPSDPTLPPTRFGLRAEAWLALLAGQEPAPGGPLDVRGVQFHLHGYDPAARGRAVHEAVRLVDALRDAGHEVEHVDIGGGVPMSYLDDGARWREFWDALRAEAEHGPEGAPLCWDGDTLGVRDVPPATVPPTVYPFHAELVRGPWLETVLSTVDERSGATAAGALRARGLRLRCEPGRAVLDGCGLTLARVAFRKERSDGVPLVGLHMNRTQMRSTSADVLLDPLLVRPADAGVPSAPTSAFLVGAYCIEQEVLVRRRLVLPGGVARGDLVAFPNTAGYLMHILESASHRIPLAANVVRTSAGWRRDEGDTTSADGVAASGP